MVDGQRRSAALMGVRARALEDLDADFTELLSVCDSAQAELAEAAVELGAADLQPLTADLLARQLAAARRRYRSAAARLHSLRGLARSGAADAVARGKPCRGEGRPGRSPASRAGYDGGAGGRRGLAITVVLATRPRRPPAARAGASARIATTTSAIVTSMRTRTSAATWRRWSTGRLGCKALLTSCGMAAFTTILSFLWMEGAWSVRCSRALASITRAGCCSSARSRSGADHRRTRHPALVRAIDRASPQRDLPGLAVEHQLDAGPGPSQCDRAPHWHRHIPRSSITPACRSSCQPFALAGDSVRLIVFESLRNTRSSGWIAPTQVSSSPAAKSRRAGPVPRASRDQHRRRRRARAPRDRTAACSSDASRASSETPCSSPDAYTTAFGASATSCTQGSPRTHRRGQPRARVPRRLPVDRIPRARPRTATRNTRSSSERSPRPPSGASALLAGSSFGFDTTRIYLTATRPDDDERSCASPPAPNTPSRSSDSPTHSPPPSFRWSNDRAAAQQLAVQPAPQPGRELDCENRLRSRRCVLECGASRPR